MVVEASDIRKAFGEKLLFDDFSFRLPRAGIVGVVGAIAVAGARRDGHHDLVRAELHLLEVLHAEHGRLVAALGHLRPHLGGDALAVALLEARGFTAEDFALSHPGGSLGKRLLLRVSDLMHDGSRLPQVALGSPLRDALLEITRQGLGFTCVIDSEGRLAGVYTDGDLRRTLDQFHDLRDVRVDDVMTRPGKRIGPDVLAAEAVRIMEDSRITALAVVDEQQRPIGALHMHDLLASGVI